MDGLVNEFKVVFGGCCVLIIGDIGFKGLWLVLILLELGVDVYGYVLLFEYDDGYFCLFNLVCWIMYCDGDICDFDFMLCFFMEVVLEFVFYLVVQFLVSCFYVDFKIIFDINVGGLVNVFECICQLKQFWVVVYIIFDKCYFNCEWVWGY